MAADPLVIDVAHDAAAHAHEAVVVLVEPTWGVPAVALALDAGWSAVELGPARPGAAPIPLVSFEQPPGLDQRRARCRVRDDDLYAAAAAVAAWPLVLLGAPMMARPLCARLAGTQLSRITFVPVRSIAIDEPAAGADQMSADAWWASGMLVRTLLDELDAREPLLTDAAGVAVTLAQGAEDAATQLSAGVRWRRHLDRGGHPDDLRVASAIDAVGVVPRLREVDGAYVAAAWDGATPAAGLREDRS